MSCRMHWIEPEPSPPPSPSLPAAATSRPPPNGARSAHLMSSRLSAGWPLSSLAVACLEKMASKAGPEKLRELAEVKKALLAEK